ncbi:MAG TPA: TIGR03936 family radical SAM-associated protein [Phycisphaerae bacterium]|nr:TIGR03936 family radical SAM-associated protein [Phycisphaerae bacterium]
MFRQRLRLWFRVEGDKRYLSHHDMMRVWERALRRAALPLRMSQGFNPRPKMSLVEPRSVGIASEAEILEFELADWVNPEAVLGELRRQVPADVRVDSLDLIRPTDKARPVAVIYVAMIEAPCPDLPDRIARLLGQSEAPIVRHRPKGDKALDARAFIEQLEPVGAQGVRMVLTTGPGGTVRPDEVLRLLGFDREAVARADLRRVEVRLG